MLNTVTYDVPLVSSRYAHRFINFLKSKGITKEIFKAHNPEALKLIENPDAYLSINQVIPILETAQSLLQDERAGFEFGQLLDLNAHGLFGYSLLTLEDRPQVVTTIVKHMATCLPLLDMSVLRHGSNLSIRLNNCWNIGEALPFILKIYMGSIYTAASLICKDIQFQTCLGSDLKTEDWETLTPHGRWAFNSSVNQVILPLHEAKPNKNKQHLNTVYSLATRKQKETLNQAAEKNQDSQSFAQKVRDHITKAPSHASIERSATLLNISSRYLRQQLAQEGTSFRKISSEVRKGFAEIYIKETPLPLQKIAEKLGFGDQASFTRAYRNWTGETPGEARKEAKKAQP